MTKNHEHVPGCQICGYFGSLPPEKLLWNDEHWVAAGLMDVPGWIMVGTHRHADGCWGVSDEEAEGLGVVLRNLCRAAKEATGAERVHLAAAGEVAVHFHYLIMPRRPGETPVFDSMEVSRRGKDMADPAQAAIVEARLRDLIAGLNKTAAK